MKPPPGSGKLTVFDTICLGINAIVGSGIFIFPGLLAKEVGPASILAFGVCGLLLVLVALCYAEVGSMFQQSGGPYVYARAAFGPGAGFGVGWISWVTSIFSWAAVANAVSSSVGYFAPVFNSAWAAKLVAATLILGFGFINYRGIKLGAWTINCFTLAKLVPLLLFVALGVCFIHRENFTPFRSGSGTFTHAVFLALWSLQGFEVTPFPSGESAHPRRAVPIAALASLVITALLYVLIQTVAVGVHPGLAGAGAKPLAEAAARFLGPVGGTMMALGAIISMVGYNAGNALGSPRLLSALAEDGLLPSRLAAPHPRFQTPSAAIVVTIALTAGAALVLSFQSLVDLANLAVILQYLATCTALIALRFTRPQAERLFRVPLGIPVAIGGCAVALWLAKEVPGQEVLVAAGVVCAGFLANAVWRFAKAR